VDDKINFDTLDILAAAIGVVLAFSLLPVPAHHGTERTVVGLSVLAMVTIKRLFITTKKPNPNSKGGIRFAYLFIALVGTICVGLSLLALFVDSMAEFRVGGVTETMLGFGIFLLLVATYIDRRLLKLP
jgi:hypothetical protein